MNKLPLKPSTNRKIDVSLRVLSLLLMAAKLLMDWTNRTVI